MTGKCHQCKLWRVKTRMQQPIFAHAACTRSQTLTRTCSCIGLGLSAVEVVLPKASFCITISAGQPQHCHWVSGRRVLCTIYVQSVEAGKPIFSSVCAVSFQCPCLHTDMHSLTYMHATHICTPCLHVYTHTCT